jgi:hypothetical protein
MKKLTVSFFGHRVLNNDFHVERVLEKYVLKIISENEYVEFLVGREGDFDLLVAAVIRRCKKITREDNSALIWVMPYKTKDFEINEEEYGKYYDEIEICEASSRSYFKSAHKIRNLFMIDRSDLIIFCVEHEYGGAYNAKVYAEKQCKKVFNVYDAFDEI